jgi:Na+-translocating ferredoxin:NAD+ oxidoreductase subunit G
MLILVLVLAAAGIDAAAVLKQEFATSDEVTFLEAKGNDVARLYGGKKSKAYVYVGKTAGRVDGYVILDEEIGQHEPISFAIRINGDGVVEAVKVLAYREAYGGEIKDERYLRQWRGKSAATLGGVDAISGATLSSNSTARVVARALKLFALVQKP